LQTDFLPINWYGYRGQVSQIELIRILMAWPRKRS